jgi:hypothetical protein
MVNKNKPHVLVLPEDRANLNLATGFQLEIDWTRQRQLQVLPEAGGWHEVLKKFKKDHISGMDKWPDRFMILLIDFDGHLERLQEAREAIPDHMAERVFVLGTSTEPEDLKHDLGTFEAIGRALANDCRNETVFTWGDHRLIHNANELKSLNKLVRPILF